MAAVGHAHVTVEVTLQPDAATRAWLISIGWTPPTAAQPAQLDELYCISCTHLIAQHGPDGCRNRTMRGVCDCPAPG